LGKKSEISHEEKTTMQTAQQWDDGNNVSQSYLIAVGRLLAVGTILVPLVMLLFPELNHRSGNTSHAVQDASVQQALATIPEAIPCSLNADDN
jgi:hypothetical protein